MVFCIKTVRKYKVEVFTVEEEWLVPGCRDSYQSCCCPPLPDPTSEKGRSEWEPTTLVFKGSQQAGSKGRASHWCTPLSPFDGFFTFNLWWQPARHQDHGSPASPQWLPTLTRMLMNISPDNGEPDHLPQFSHRSADGPSPTAEGCPGWKRCVRWGQCWAAGFSEAPHGHEIALWCSWWFLHLENDQIKKKKKKLAKRHFGITENSRLHWWVRITRPSVSPAHFTSLAWSGVLPYENTGMRLSTYLPFCANIHANQ